MKILQGAAFTALLVGAAGVTGPDGAIQPAAVVLVVVSLIVLLAAAALEKGDRDEIRS